MALRRELKSFAPPHLLSLPLERFFSGRNGDELAQLRSEFSTGWDAYILGGVLRNLLLKEMRGLDVPSVDVDVVVNGPQFSGQLQAALQNYIVRQNDFGGAKCRAAKRENRHSDQGRMTFGKSALGPRKG